MNKEAEQMERLLAEHLNVYIKAQHTQDECIGFIDGFKEALKQVKNLNIDDVSVSDFIKDCKKQSNRRS